MRLGGDGDDVDYRSLNSGMLCLSPTLVVGHPFFDFPPTSTHEVVPSSRRDVTMDHLYRPDSINMDSPTMPDVLSDSDETACYVEDRRFCERLASFGDESFDNGESKLASRNPEHRRSASHHADSGASENAGEDRHWPSRRANKTATETGENVNVGDSLNDRKSLRMTTCTAVICQPREQPLSTTSVKLSLSDATGQSTAADCSAFYQLTAAKDYRSRSICAESVEESSDAEQDVTFVESESKVDEDTAQVNCTSEEIKREIDTRRHVDVFGESEKSLDSPLDTTLSKQSNRIDEVGKNEDNGHYHSRDNNTETDEEITKVNSNCSHQRFSGIDRIITDRSKHEIFDSCASIYDRIEKYYGIPNRRKQISCTKELSQLELRVSSYHVAEQLSNDKVHVELSSAARKRSNNLDASVNVDIDTVNIQTDSVKSQPHISYPTETQWVTEYPMTSAHPCQHFQCNDTDLHTEVDVKTPNERNCTAESTENGPGKDVAAETSSGYKQSDENTAATLAILQSGQKGSLKDDVIVRSESLKFGTMSDNNSLPMLARQEVPADVDLLAVGNCSSTQKSLDKKTQLVATDASVITRDAETRNTDCLPEDVSDSERVLPKTSCDTRQSADADSDTTQLTTTNAGASVVSSDIKLGGSIVSDVGVKSRRPWSTSAQSLSFIMVDIDIDESRPSMSSTVCEEHRQRLEAMKKQLMNAKPVAPTSSSIDSTWNSRIEGKLTPASRSRSAVWTPYDTVFSEATTMRPSATDSQLWRTKSLQTLPGKFTSAGLWYRPSDSMIDLGSENVGTGIAEDSQEADVSSDKSKSLSDLRHMPEDEPRMQVHAIGSIDAGLNNEKKTASLSSAAPLRPLPSEEFIRRSLERLSLPDWYLNSSSSLPSKKVVGIGRKSAGGTIKVNATSFSTVDVRKPKEADWQLMAVTDPSPASHVALSLVTSSDVPTSLSACHHSQVSHCPTADQFATSENLQTALDGHTSIHQTSIHRATDGVFSSTEIHTNGGVTPSECQSRERRHHKRTTKADENEKYDKCPHGKRNSAKCSQCRNKVLETGLSPTRRGRTLNEHMWNRSSPGSRIESSTVLPSEVFQTPAANKGDNNCDSFSYTTAKESITNHITRKINETTTRRKSRTQNKKNTLVENNQNEVTMTTDYNVIGNQALCYQKVTVNSGNVEENGEENGQKMLSFVPLSQEAHGAPRSPEVRPRSLRVRKVKSKTCSEDVGLRTDVSDQNISKQKISRSSSDNQVTDSAHRNPIYEMAGSLSSRNRIPAKALTSIASTTDDALEINGSKYARDIPAKVLDQNAAVEADIKQERKVQRRRRRRQKESTCPDALSQAYRLTVRGDQSIIDSNYLQTQRSNRCDNNHAVNAELTRIPLERHDGEGIGEGTDNGVGRQRRRTDNRRTIAESPSGECFQHKEEFQDRFTADSNDRTASASHRRPRRRLRNHPSSRVNVEPHRPEIDDPPIETTTTPDSKHKQRLQHCPANEQSTNMLPVLDSSEQGDNLEHTVKLFFEGSPSTLMEEYPKTTSSRPADEFTSSTSRHRDRPRRRFRSSTVTDSNSFPADSATPEVINAQSQLKQDGTYFESTSNWSESPPTERKPCMSAAARRCRRVHKSQRSR